MPLTSIRPIEGRTEAELKTILDAAHRAMLAAFGAGARPLSDRARAQTLV